MSFKISTINIFSFINKNKIMFIKDFLTQHNIDICFIQETHIDDAKTLDYIKEIYYSYDFFTTLTNGNSRGVGVFLRKERGIKILNEFFDCENRVHGIEVCINNKNYTFINIYSPTSSYSQCEFIQNLYSLLSSKKNLFLGGDFNFVEDREYERNNNNLWKTFYKNFNLCEFEWNVSSTPIKECYTWSKGLLKSRIDRLYCERYLKQNCKYIDVCETGMSDHKMVICEIKLYNYVNKPQKNILWKLNESVLENENVNEGIIKLCKKIPDLINNNKSKWYDVFINKVCNFLKRESRIINSQLKQEKNHLFQELKDIDSMCELNEISIKKREIREKINKYYENIRTGNEKRMRNERMKFIKQPTKVLMQEERKSNACCLINNYITSDGVRTKELKTIKSDISNFYKELLGQEKIEEEKINNYKFNIKSMNVEESVRERLNEVITYDEVFKIIKNMKESAPGSSGLTIGFYKKYFKHFGVYFVEMLNSEDELPLLFKESIVKLIPKNNNDVKTINDLRPISLTNIDYRIYTKVLANRMRLVADCVIGDHQTCSIKNRRINDNISLIRDVISEFENTGFELFILSVDQSKAFDRISHRYLFRILEHMNFGNFILSAIRKIYHKSRAKIVVNNTLCEDIIIESGLKQGCALSMLLYIICIEELIVRIENNCLIKGVVLNTTNRYECKASGYADDIAGFLRDQDSMREFFKEFKEWGRVSAASLNVEKTKILALNSSYNQFEGIIFVKEMKILGIEFNSRGITTNNINKVVENIKKSISIWDGVYLSTLERVIVSKTFILSKLWYLTNFVILSEESIKKIDRMIHQFIWNKSFELIKRNTLILPYESGGLNSVCIRAKIETSLIQNFINIYLNNSRMFYQLGVKYLKFELRHLKIFTNFNIIPVTEKKPKIYNEIFESVKNIRSKDSDFFKNIKKYNSKYTYNKLICNYAIRPKIENFYECENWVNVYKNIHNSESSDLRSFLYKLLFNALPIHNRFNNNKNMCFFCEKKKEDVSHVFFKCSVVSNFFKNVQDTLDEHNFILTKKTFLLNINITKHDYKKTSIFLYTVSLLRDLIKKAKNNSNMEAIFKSIYKKQIELLM